MIDIGKMSLNELVALRDFVTNRIRHIESDAREERYKANIKNLGIKMADVQLSDAESTRGRWFNTLPEFLAWCRSSSTKKFREWNQQVFIGDDYMHEVCDLDSLRKYS